MSEYEDFVAPHCDQSVLHAPGVCEYCDLYPQRQRDRDEQRINFSGQHDPYKAPCPSEYFRSEKTINMWPGNTPAGYNDVEMGGFIKLGLIDGAPGVKLITDPPKKPWWRRFF